MTFNIMFNKMFSDIWFYNEYTNMYIQVEGIDMSESGIIRCHYFTNDEELVYVGADGWGRGEELKDAIRITKPDKIKELNTTLAKSILLGDDIEYKRTIS